MRTNLLRDLADTRHPRRNRVLSADHRRCAGRRWPHRSRLRRAAIGHGVAFETWQSLAHEGLSDAEAAKLIIGLISTADQARSRCGLSSSKPATRLRQVQGAQRGLGRTTTNSGRMPTCEMLIACSACWNSWVDSPW